MAWPKGKPRKPLVAENSPQESPNPIPAPQTPPPQKRPKMKAKPNWENFEPNAVEDDMGPLHIPQDMFPEGFDFQWVTTEVYGQQMPRERAKFERTGWTPVCQEDFDGIFNGRFMPRDAEGDITVDGLVLMARPLKYSLEAKRRERREAQERVAIKEQQLRGGDNPNITLGADHPSAVRTNRINKTIEPISIPDND